MFMEFRPTRHPTGGGGGHFIENIIIKMQWVYFCFVYVTKTKATGAGLAFYIFYIISSSGLINTINHDHSCKIIYEQQTVKFGPKITQKCYC